MQANVEAVEVGEVEAQVADGVQADEVVPRVPALRLSVEVVAPMAKRSTGLDDRRRRFAYESDKELLPVWLA